MSDEKISTLSEDDDIVLEMDKVNLGGDFSFEDEEEVESTPPRRKKPEKISQSKPKDDEISFEDEGTDNVLSSSEKLRLYSDQIISCMLGSSESSSYALGRLLSITTPALFRDENYVIFLVLYNYRDKVRRLSIDSEFLQLYLYRNRKLLDKSRQYIDIGAYGEIDGQEDLAYIAGVVKHFNRLREMPDISREDFNLVFEKYLIEFKAIESEKVYTNAQLILTNGMRLFGRKYIGSEDSFNYVKKQMAEIEGLVDMNQGTGFKSMADIILEEKDDRKKPMKVADFGNLESLNKVYGGIYTGTFYQVLAPPKGGKTKFCTRICHTASVKYGTNVTVWAAEGGYNAWTAQMRAIHFDYTYNTGVDVRERKFGVSQDAILKDSFPSKELADLELSSKLDLSSNPDYGKVDFVDTPFNVENFLEDIDTSVKSNNSKLIIIDYLQYIGSSENKSERERVAEAYKTLLAYCRMNNIAVISPGQYKQEVISQLMGMNDVGAADMRTSGGTSSEVLRTPDIIFALWASTQDLLNNSMKILSMPCRFNKPFSPISVYADMETCDFISLDE